MEVGKTLQVTTRKAWRLRYFLKMTAQNKRFGMVT